MDSNIIDELYTRIQELESDLESKKQKILELESTIESLKNPKPDEPLPELKPMASGLKAFVSQKLSFVLSVQKGVAKIEFPLSLLRVPSEEPTLSRTLSTNSYISQAISDIEAFSNKKKEIEATIEEKKTEIFSRAEQQVQEFRDSFTGQLCNLSEETNKFIESISKKLKGNLILETETQKMFKFEDLSSENLQVTLTQIKDSNGLALKQAKTVTESIFEFKKYRAVIKSEGDQILSTLSSSTMNIYYQLIEIENNEKICCPVNITPQFITLQDYEIKYNNSQSEITEVLNKTDGPVLFTTVVVSEDCGLLQTSMIEVFTSVVSDHIFNIVHLHIEDMKDEVPLEAVYMLPDQTSSEYEDWSQDALGRNLRYKVLVKSGQVDSILYNTGSTTEKIDFIERRLENGKLMAYNENIVQVLSVPTGLLSRDWLGAKSNCEEVERRKPIEGQCVSRYVEDIPGFIDVKLVIENGKLSQEQREFAVPACLLHSLSQSEVDEVGEVLRKQKNSVVEQAEGKILKIQDMVNAYLTMSVKANREFLNELTELVRQAKEVLGNNPELQAKHSGLVGQAERAIRNLALDLRFNPS